MNDFIFFYPTRYYLGGACIVHTLMLTLASKSDEQAERLRECCLEHVRYWEETEGSEQPRNTC
jgi:hypothetical protein